MRYTIVVIAMSQLSIASAHADSPSVWKTGSGSWADADRWDGGPPTDLRTAELHGEGEVVVPPGRFAAGMIRYSNQKGDNLRLRIQGELVARRNFIQVGEYHDSKAEIVLESGALQTASAMYVGGAGAGADGTCSAVVTVRGGSLLARYLTFGWGPGSVSTLHVDGSKPAAVHVLDAVMVGTEHRHSPSDVTLQFTLDRFGVTPITIASRTEGFSITPGSAGNRCRLKLLLSDIPPRDDIVLVATRARIRGTLTELPEGSEVSASYAGRTFRWTLTYNGGSDGRSLALTKVRGHAANDPQTSSRPLPAPPKRLWQEISSRPALPESWEPASEGAEGFGAMARGGRGGRDVDVTNLNDSGPGSLRAAVEAQGPRSVRFRVAGTIELASMLQVRHPYLTIDGSHAPAPGITLSGRGMMVHSHDVVLRHFRIRPGVPSSVWEGDPLEFEGAERCIADHLSLAWATDETLSVVGLSDCITVQWCLISEPLNDRKHSYGSILGGDRTTWHHNLYAHALSRVPRFAGVAHADFRNNVLYNWGHTCGYGEFERANYVGNYLKPGPSTTQRPLRFLTGTNVAEPESLFLSGNVLVGLPEITRDNALGTAYDREVLATTPFSFPAVATDEAEAAYERVLEHGGATLPLRDAVDRRVIRETREGTGRIIDKRPE